MDIQGDREALTEGLVIEAMPSALFKIKLNSDKEILAYLSGKMRLHRIKVLVGDRVSVKLDEYGGKTSSRIVKRL
ncbi:MAG: translation initiation factor IF-1 [Candidatus Lloydbacteria bacterium RIFCSPHIGHO2_01_FULL_41_20]|uniref:Translation initiation factor IF-1 n=1 Tax=Candidatus Lloydbacteria bacterium RIFCSPHIGHO2_01_FULL_41_20 TaxID=1798657 RepID=A0A1G2CRH7_9BACT|nr:MAG: translation initiation factor IF-1 [Candidatus Lloydbacteria bacterium RIFCSPHIGHO2_01_FULL_41_20]